MNTTVGFSIYHDLVIESSIEKVFDAISLPQQLEDWWPLKCSGKAELGEEYNFNFTDQYDWYGKVVKIEEPHQFYIQMTQADPDWNPTTFGFDLEEKEGKTIVHFFHRNWEKQNTHFKIASYCWAILLKGLKDYVEKGIIVPFEKRN